MMRAILAGCTVLFTAFMLAATPSTATAQGCDDCDDEHDEIDGWYHWFGTGALFSCAQGDGCHSGERLGTCGHEHETCFETEELVEETVAAAWSGSSAELNVALKKYPKSVTYDKVEGVLHFRNCKVQYVGAVIVPTRVGLDD